jgi:hypothetical protein
MKWVASEVYTKQKADGFISDSALAKLEQAIDVHEYRGPSKKRHNGVVPLPPRDKNLWKFYHATRALAPPGFDGGLPVKVVAHIPTGHRLVGIMRENTLFVLGVAQY